MAEKYWSASANKVMQSPERQMMHVRFLGTKACWTLISSGRFYIGDREELTAAERELCENGGGELPASVAVLSLAK